MFTKHLYTDRQTYYESCLKKNQSAPRPSVVDGDTFSKPGHQLLANLLVDTTLMLFANIEHWQRKREEEEEEEADKVEVAPGVAVASLRRFRAALIEPTQAKDSLSDVDCALKP